MELYLVRHGEAEHNIGGYYVNEKKSDLTETGRKQAEAVAKRFEDVPIDLIACSKLERAAQTAVMIFKKKEKCKVVYTPLLNEKRFPSEFTGQKSDSEIVKRISEEIFKHRLDRKWHYSDEENWFDFVERVSKCIDYLEGLGKENILVVSHGLFIKTLCSVLLVQKNHHYDEWIEEYGDEILYKILYHTVSVFSMANTGVTVVGKEQEGNWKIRTYNDFSHL